jgi:outer membrane protein assembly factor BamB
LDRLAEDVDLKLLKWKAPIPAAPSLAAVPRYYHPRYGRVGGGNANAFAIKGAPAFWRDNVIVNTGNSLMMFNIQTGKRVGGDLICGNPFDNNGLVNLSYSSLRNCVVDKDRVFSVFKRSARIDVQGQAMPFIRGGELVSFDLNTGKILWVMNSANATDKKATFFLDQCMFTSTPTLYNDVIYLEAVLPKTGMPESHIVAISAETGKFLWERFICAFSLNDNNPNARRHWQGDDFESYRLRYSGQGGMLCDGNRLYFCTELGVMGALNAISGEIYWLRKYNAHPGGFSWQAASPLMIGKSIVFAPTTSNDIYWLNPQDGSLEGFFKGEYVTEDINNASQIIGVSGEKLYLYYQNAVQEIGARSSKRLDQWGAYGATSGGGVISENRIYLPSKVNIMQISLKNKKIEYACGGETPAEIGNLSIYRGCLFSLSDNMLSVYQGEKPVTPLPNVPKKPRPPFVPPAGLSPDAVKAAKLIYDLGDNDFAVRENAGAALVALKPVAYDLLINELNNSDPEISNRVRVLLIKMGWKSPEELESQFTQLYVVQYVLHPNQGVRDQYENNVLAQMGLNAVQPLVKRTTVANQPDWRLRDSAIRMLGRLKPLPPNAIASMIEALKSDPENPVRITAKNSLTAATGQNFPSNQPQLWENWLKEQQAKQTKK